MDGHFFTDFKSSNRIEISWLVQVLLNFYWFLGFTPLEGWWIGGWEWGWVWVCGRVSYSHTHTHMHAYTCMHACTCMLNMLIMDASMLVAICNFYTCIHVCMCMCMHARTCACVGDTPHAHRCPWHPLTHLPPPQSRREPKTAKFNKSWTNRDNSILFEDSLPLNIPELIYTIADYPRHPPPTCPTPQSWENPNRKNYNNSWTNWDNSILFKDLWPLNPPAHI